MVSICASKPLHYLGQHYVLFLFLANCHLLLQFQHFFTCQDSIKVHPGLAQLVERLTHSYSESTSSNPGNLTSAGNSMCGQDLSAVKRSAGVASEVDLRECTLRLPLQCE